MTPQDAEELNLLPLTRDELYAMARTLRLLLKVSREEGAVLAEQVKVLQGRLREQARCEQEDYRSRRENW